MSKIKMLLLSGAALLAGCNAETATKSDAANVPPIDLSIEAPTPSVNQKLATHMQKFAKAQLIKMSDRVYMAQGYSYSNFAFVEGDTGVIMIDTGWWTGPAEKALADFRNISDKPISHIFYTHGHGDHVGGVATFTKDGSIPIYGHANYERYRNETVSSRMPFILKRAVDQMGPLLPDNVGSGIGITTMDGRATYFPPSILLSGGEKLNIDGVRIEIINAPSDIDDEYGIWLPDEKVLAVGDAWGGTGPYASTPRNELGRDPYAFIRTLDMFLDYPAEAIVPGHGRAIIGADDARQSLLNARDMIQFLTDSVVNAINSGTPRDVALANLDVPPHLANDPDLQWHYHTMGFVWRGLYSRLGGWYGDNPIELFEPTPQEQAANMVELAGGRDSILLTAKNSYTENDFHWAAKLAQAALTIDPTDEKAKNILVNALNSAAYASESTSQRNYLLTEALLLRGQLDRSKQKPLLAVGALLGSAENIKLVEALTPRIDPKASANVKNSWIVKFIGEPEKNLITVRKGVATVRPLAGHPNPPEHEITLSRQTMIGILLGQSTFARELDSGTIETNNLSAATKFFMLFDG